MKQKLVIFGCQDQAEVAEFLFRHDTAFAPVAFTVDGAYLKESTFKGLPVVPFEELAQTFSPQEHSFFAAIGYTRMNRLRAEKYFAGKELGYSIASYVSSKAMVWPGTQLGENCLILELNNIQPFVQIGNNVTLWSGNHIGHHSAIRDNCFLTSHVVVSGRVEIGTNCFLGVNSTIRDKTLIAQDCLIAAGSLVVKNTEAGGVYVGSPAKKQDRSSLEITI
jgi:sugar O-acyltransferase (sialic acid O-acetyltransferase NeuD family)